MGIQADCQALIGGRADRGRLRLEARELQFDGARRLRVPLEAIRSAVAREGRLEVRHQGGSASFRLGKDAETWALKIRYPRSRIDKLGVKPGSRVAVIGLEDRAFEQELRSRTHDVAKARPKPETDLVFVFMKAKREIDRLRALRSAIKPEGGIWVLWAKGRTEFREDDVRAAGPRLGLVDVKVVSFSDRLSGLKLVIPVALRPKPKKRGKRKAGGLGE